MENLIKKKMDVADANGWYLAEAAYRKWSEDFVDEGTGEVVSIERNEIIEPVGSQLTAITISMLQENGVSEILVSNKQITGNQQKHMSLWQLEAVVYDPVLAKDRSEYYIIPKGSPLECEVFFKEWAELNITGSFTIKKVVPLDFSYALLPYEDEVTEAATKNIGVHFYKAVLKPSEGSSLKVLTCADNIHTVEQQVHVNYIERGIYRISEIKEINIKKFFEEGINVTRYSLGMHNPNITGHFITELNKL